MTDCYVGRVLLFGGNGAIAGAIRGFFEKENWQVISVTRKQIDDEGYLYWDPFCPDLGELDGLLNKGPYDAICWAQGANINDSIYTFDADVHQSVYQANVLYILESLKILIANDLLLQPIRMCVISSIWQEMARQNKLSYCITKSALKGLVLSLANDLGKDGHLVNAVLPGVIDTPMTRKNLSENQLEKIVQSTQFGRLPSLLDVASAVYGLCSKTNTGITGQFVTVDLGYSHVRII